MLLLSRSHVVVHLAIVLVGEMLIDKTELAWAAGFFDGEGSIRVHDKLRMHLAVKQVDRRPLDRFVSAVEAGNVTGPYIANSKDGYNRKPYHQMNMYSVETVCEAVSKLLPYLSEPKREQIWRVFVELQLNQDRRSK